MILFLHTDYGAVAEPAPQRNEDAEGYQAVEQSMAQAGAPVTAHSYFTTSPLKSDHLSNASFCNLPMVIVELYSKVVDWLKLYK